MIGTINIQINAANPNMPLKTLFAFVGSPSSVRIIDVPKKIGNWRITKVYVVYNYPDNVSDRKECVLTGGCYVGTIPASTETGKSVNGYAIVADGIDEDGNDITGYVLGLGDICILDADGHITVDGKTVYLHFVNSMPDSPVEGDVIYSDGKWKIYHNSEWIDFGGGDIAWGTIIGNIADQADLKDKFDAVDSVTNGLQSEINAHTDDISMLQSSIGQIRSAITPTAPSTEADENALAGAKSTADFVNSSINAFAAFYITKDAAGNAFATKAELLNATVYYSGGQIRVPTKNDYCIVLADESHPTSLTNPTTRYTYNSQWEFQYIVNNTSLTQAQINAINSGITSQKVSAVDSLISLSSELRLKDDYNITTDVYTDWVWSSGDDVIIDGQPTFSNGIWSVYCHERGSTQPLLFTSDSGKHQFDTQVTMTNNITWLEFVMKRNAVAKTGDKIVGTSAISAINGYVDTLVTGTKEDDTEVSFYILTKGN